MIISVVSTAYSPNTFRWFWLYPSSKAWLNVLLIQLVNPPALHLSKQFISLSLNNITNYTIIVTVIVTTVADEFHSVCVRQPCGTLFPPLKIPTAYYSHFTIKATEADFRLSCFWSQTSNTHARVYVDMRMCVCTYMSIYTWTHLSLCLSLYTCLYLYVCRCNMYLILDFASLVCLPNARFYVPATFYFGAVT